MAQLRQGPQLSGPSAEETKEAERLSEMKRAIESDLKSLAEQGSAKTADEVALEAQAIKVLKDINILKAKEQKRAAQVAFEAEAKTAIEQAESEDESGFQTAPEDESDESDFETGDEGEPKFLGGTKNLLKKGEEVKQRLQRVAQIVAEEERKGRGGTGDLRQRGVEIAKRQQQIAEAERKLAEAEKRKALGGTGDLRQKGVEISKRQQRVAEIKREADEAEYKALLENVRNWLKKFPNLEEAGKHQAPDFLQQRRTGKKLNPVAARTLKPLKKSKFEEKMEQIRSSSEAEDEDEDEDSDWDDSPRRKSKRKLSKRKSPKRKSPKRKSPKRKSPKRALLAGRSLKSPKRR